MIVFDPIRFWSRQAPDRTALVDRARGRRIAYAELDALADAWAGALRSAGVGAGERVAVLSANRVEVVALLAACERIGAALVPLNWRLGAAELAPMLVDARPVLLLGEARFRLAAAASPVRWVDLDTDAPALLAHADPHGPADDVAAEPEAAALVLYTSGSTGAPKGAVLPRRQLAANAFATTTAWELSSADVGVVTTPFFHTGGWNVLLLPLLARGGTVVLLDRFEPADFLAALGEEGITVAFGVPTQLVMLLESPSWGTRPATFRLWYSGGAACPVSVAERTRAAGWRLREGFGLTECGPNCFTVPDEVTIARPACVGWPVPGLEMRLVDESGADVGVDEPGELLLRGPQVFSGYLHAPEKTAEVLDADGWLHTGDLARRGSDGAYTICGRRKEMFISGGENVFPGEVETALADCPGVAEVAVIGVPDARWGEVGRAFVAPRAGAALSADDVLRHARVRLAGYKVPRSVVLVDALPRLGSGKIDRRALAAHPGPAATV